MSTAHTVPTTALETTTYRQKLALHILSSSPALAMHYASRLQRLNPSLPPLTPISCPRCENMFVHGRGTIRMARRALVKDCYACGEISSTPRPTGQTKVAFPSVRARMYARRNAASKVLADQEQHEVQINEPVYTNTTQSPQPAPILPTTTQQYATKRPKSKGVLQNMLQRNRERELRESRNDNTNNGLALFLQGL